MSDDVGTQQVPPSVEDSAGRIMQRPPDAFARFPAREVAPTGTFGSGQYGAVDDGPRWPLVAICLGYFAALSTFIIGTPWMLLVGVVLVLGGAIANQRSKKVKGGHRGGTGPVTLRD